MNFLSLCQSLARRCGIGGGSGPSSVVGAAGENARTVEWIMRAWLDIQAEHTNWKFLWAQHTGTAYAGDTEILAPDDWAMWDKKHLYIDDIRIHDVIEYEDYTSLDDSTGRPKFLVQMPDGDLKMVPIPDVDYTYSLDYYRTPQELVNDNDAPLCPAQFHDVIVLWAMQKYGHFEAAPEVLSSVSTELSSRLTALRASQLPGKQMFVDSHDSRFMVTVE